MRLLIPSLLVLVLCLNPGPLAAHNTDFERWLVGVKKEAKRKGIAEATLTAAFKGVKPIPRVIELDRKQPEFTLTFNQYLERVVPKSRVEKGRQMYQQNKVLLDEVAAKFGVQARFIVAFWGIETDYGRVTGGFPVIAALATLAHDGRRSKYFRAELMHALKILDEKHITAEKMFGSWAGAMGQSQFMPSSFVAYAVDHNGDGRRDIWHSKADVFASAANYLKRSGWRNKGNWGREVNVPKSFNRGLAGHGVRKKLASWQKLGVRRPDGTDLPAASLSASVVLPQKGALRPAYLAYANFRVILRWNRSDYFALAVGHLADGIGGRN